MRTRGDDLVIPARDAGLFVSRDRGYDSGVVYQVPMIEVAVTIAIVLRVGLTPVVGPRFPFITLFPALFFSAWYGGFRPTVLATALGSLVASYVFIPPPYQWGGATVTDRMQTVASAWLTAPGAIAPL